MCGASIPPGELFAHHHVDLSRPGALVRLVELLRTDGLATFGNVRTRAEVSAWADRLMVLSPHPDADADGLTTIRNTGRHAHRPGLAGFGNGALEPHTERSGVPRPPRLVMLVCGRAANTGGASVLVDGRAVLADLTPDTHGVIAALSEPRTARFGAGYGHSCQVITVHPQHRVELRLRLDDLAHFSPLVLPAVPRLRAAIARRRVLLPLARGQGYVLDNHRWLHARTAFTGDRTCWRGLGVPRFALAEGFALAPTPPRLPVMAGSASDYR